MAISRRESFEDFLLLGICHSDTTIFHYDIETPILLV